MFFVFIGGIYYFQYTDYNDISFLAKVPTFNLYLKHFLIRSIEAVEEPRRELLPAAVGSINSSELIIFFSDA